MRPFEILLALSIFARVLFHARLPRWAKSLPIPIAIAQLVLEGYRWQMLPLYLVTFLGGILTLRNLDPWKGAAPRWMLLLGSVLVAPLLAVGIALPILLPIPQTPAPTGPHAVGTTTLVLVDESRMDPYAPNPDQPRELLVQIWYPAETVQGLDRAPWMEGAEIVAPAISAWLGLPGFALDHLAYARSDSYTDAPLLPGSHPLILFSHGFGGFRAQNTFQMQELASHGYIAAAVEHTYASVVTLLPDGRVAAHNPLTLPDGLSDAEYEAAAELLVGQWTDDLAFVLDELLAQSAAAEGMLAGAIQPDAVGAMGHSTGGGAAVQFCAVDERCRAVLGMDPWLLPVLDDLLAAGLEQPGLHLFSEEWTSGPNVARTETLIAGSPEVTQAYSIDGTLHYDFSDLPAVSPLAPYIHLKGPIDGLRVHTLIRRVTLAFFDQTLLDSAEPMLSAVIAEYPELQVFGR